MLSPPFLSSSVCPSFLEKEPEASSNPFQLLRPQTSRAAWESGTLAEQRRVSFGRTWGSRDVSGREARGHWPLEILPESWLKLSSKDGLFPLLLLPRRLTLPLDCGADGEGKGLSFKDKFRTLNTLNLRKGPVTLFLLY